MMEATSDGANGYYDNKADLTYGERLWTPSGVGPDYGSFSQPKKTTEAAKATFRQVQTNPLITAKVFSMYDGSGATDSAMEKEADKRNALVNEPNAGWRFRFGNTSASRMAPALINIGPVPDGFKYIKDPATGNMVLDPTSSKKSQFVASAVKLGPAYMGTYDPDTNTYADDAGAKVEKVTLTYYATTAASDVTKRTLEIPGSKLLDYFKPETKKNPTTGAMERTGNYVLTCASYNIGYLLNVDIELEQFTNNKTVDAARAMVEIIGTPESVGELTVAARFGTDYENPTGNKSVSGQATLNSMFVPIKPAVAASYGYVDNTGARKSNAAVPYRWGDKADEIAYFRYDLSNNSPYDISSFDVDMVINGTKQEALSDEAGAPSVWRGFLARSLVVPGFAYGAVPVLDADGNPTYDETTGDPITKTCWHYRYGEISSVDVLDVLNPTATILHTEEGLRPNASYDIAAALDTLGAAGGAVTLGDGATLTMDSATGMLTLNVAANGSAGDIVTDGLVSGTVSDGATEKAPVKMLRVRFAKINKGAVTSDSGAIVPPAANTAPVMYVFGRADSHDNAAVTTEVRAFATKSAYGPDMMLPDAVRLEGNVNKLRATAKMQFGTFAATLDWSAVKPAGVRPNPGAAAEGKNVEVANFADGTGYNFTVRNNSLNRADDAVVTIRTDQDLSGFLKDPVNDVRGFKTKEVTFGEELFNFGSTVRKDNTVGATDNSSLENVTFYFRRVVETGSGASTSYETVSDGTFADQGYSVRYDRDELLAMLEEAKAADSAATGFSVDVTSDNPDFAALHFLFDRPLAAGGTATEKRDFYLERIEIRYSEIDPYVSADKQFAVKLRGQANSWYNNVSSDGAGQFAKVNAQAKVDVTAKLDNPGEKGKADAFLKVYFPAMAVHTFGQYGATFNKYMNHHTFADAANCSDGSFTRTGVPYDRDFKMWANLTNEHATSTLDDVDVTVDLQMNYEKVLQLDANDKHKDGGTVSDYTGFHTTKVTVNHELFDTFRHGTVGAITFTGRKEGAGADAAAAVSWTIRPDGVYRALDRAVVPAADALPDHFEDATDATQTYEFTAEGDLVITEEMLRNHGIENLTQVKLVSWQDMAEDAAPGANNTTAPATVSWDDGQNIVFDGFADHNFDTERLFSAKTENYLLKLRGDAMIPGMKNTPVTRTDRSWIYMSKMYFDTLNRAGLYDSNAGGVASAPTNGNRFSQYSWGSWDSCHIAHNDSYASDAERNFALDVGYKSQVSLLADFRQVNTQYNEYGPERTCHTEQGPWTSYNFNGRNLYWVGAETYNSGMVLHMVQDLKDPSQYFDAYYLKIRRQAAEYVDNLKITYSDGKTLTLTGDEIKQQLAGTAADAVQSDYDGAKYFRLNLLARDGAGEPEASFGTGADRSDSYRDPVDDYYLQNLTRPGAPRFTVTRIEYDIRINQNQYASGDNRYVTGDWTESDSDVTTLNQPDYGKWFGKVNNSYADIVNQMSFEVNGRMYAETPTGGMNMYTDVTLEVGGTNSGNDRPGHQAIVRSDTKDSRANTSGSENKNQQADKNRFCSAWSYQDYHRTGNYWHHYDGVAYMRHLRSRTNVVARNDGNYTMQGINWNGKDATRLGDTADAWNSNPYNMTEHGLFGGDTNFAIAFYRQTIYRGIYSGDASYSNTWGNDQYYPNDWGWNYTSFTDKVKLTDRLPWCQPDDDLSFYGFLSTGLHFQNGVLDHLRDYEDATITFTTRQWKASDELNDEGFTIYEEDAAGAHTYQVRRDGVYDITGGKDDRVGDLGIDHLTRGKADVAYLEFARPGEDSHSAIVDLKKTGDVVALPLATNEFVTSYEIDLGPYSGNGDITAEGAGHNVDRDANEGTVDIQLLGRPYIYKGQKHPAFKGAAHDSCGDKKDALNYAYAWGYSFAKLGTSKGDNAPFNQSLSLNSDGTHPGASNWKSSSNASVTHRNEDTAYFLGYLIPFGYNSRLSLEANGTDHPSMAD